MKIVQLENREISSISGGNFGYSAVLGVAASAAAAAILLGASRTGPGKRACATVSNGVKVAAGSVVLGVHNLLGMIPGVVEDSAVEEYEYADLTSMITAVASLGYWGAIWKPKQK